MPHMCSSRHRHGSDSLLSPVRSIVVGMKVIRSTHHTRLAAIAAATALLSLSLASAANAAVATGPSGDTFFTPSATKLKAGKHGAPIWVRPAQSALALSNASSAYNIVYKSQSLAKKDIAVSGAIWIPKGTAPAGGWPVISWGHGTTGSADACAPSRITDTVSGAYTSYMFGQFNAWLAAGYAVVMSDYEGLGTPGPHPYLIGQSEGRGVVDIVKAAHTAFPAIGSKWVAAGHSQGGHAVLFAASIAKTWGTGLTFKGVAAYSPANNLKTTVIFAAGAVKSPNGLSGLGALILRSVTYADKTLTLPMIMNPAAVPYLPHIETRCLGDQTGVGLGATDSFGQFAPGNLLKGWTGSTWTDAKVKKGLDALNGTAMDPSLKITGPIQVFQGGADGTVPSFTTDALVAKLGTINGSSNVVYTKYPSADHGGVVTAAGADALAWFNARFGR